MKLKKAYKKPLKKKRKCAKLSDEFTLLENDEQLILLLDSLTDIHGLNRSLLKDLNQFFDLDQRNVEVRHVWCELIVKNKYSNGYGTLKNFLVEEQSMGVYLYGEMIFSKNTKLKNLAFDIFESIKGEMNISFKEVVTEMFENAEHL